MEMSWQDLVLSVGQILFFVALLPSIWSPGKPALMTSVMTATILTVFVVTFWTLDLLFAAVTTTLAASAWWILAYQRWQQKRSPILKTETTPSPDERPAA
jgi:threonine/homoserine/homoserine lactone efflux protein